MKNGLMEMGDKILSMKRSVIGPSTTN